jgi:hypothetical protein
VAGWREIRRPASPPRLGLNYLKATGQDLDQRLGAVSGTRAPVAQKRRGSPGWCGIFSASVPIRGLRDQEARRLTVWSLPAEFVEFPVVRAADKCLPFARGKLENRPFGMPAVAKSDAAIG